MQIKLMPKKQLYHNSTNGYRVLSCVPIGEYPELELTVYKNFTLNGSNISNLEIGQEYELEIRKDKRSKYPASYCMICWAGIEVGEKITIAPEQELSFLKQFMESSQAKYVNEAYPNFVQLVIDGRESEIDVKKIYNVGPVRFEKYVNDVKGHFHSLKYFPIANEWDITDAKYIDQLSKTFLTPEDLQEAFDKNPYHVFFNLLHFPFAKTDKAVLAKRPDLIHSKERCELGCMEILRQNELEGDTRIDSDLLMEMAVEMVPECEDLVLDTLNDSEEIYYDSKAECASYQSTYNNEKLIAEALINRIKNPESMGMDWRKFTNVDGFECTDEQAKILELANENKAVMLRGYSGTGKSTVMKALVLMLEHYFKDYIQLAPTGKAAARLRETTGRDASTIHMFLARLRGEPGATVSPDYVIVDEMSMVGVDLLAALLEVLSPETRLVFVCDEAQLASISCGNIVQDIIDSNTMPHANLTKVFRYGTSGLATIATDTRNGKMGIRDGSTKFDDYTFYEGINPVNQIVDMYGKLLDEGYSQDDILILCPYNKTSNGTYRINQEIQTRYNTHTGSIAKYEIKGEATITFKVGDKVINTKNNYHMPCFDYEDDGSIVESNREIFVANGDIGKVRFIKEVNNETVMGVQFDNEIACVSGAAITELLLGYAITIHKSQGSQAKVIIMYTDKIHKRMVSRNLLYVADSRAQEKLIEIGDLGTIEEGLKKQENKERDTWLKEMLVELAK